AVLPIRSDGTTGEARITQLSGSGPSPRQKGPHPHQVLELPDGTILVPDLGTDTIARYRFNVSDGELSPAKPSGIPVAPGTGPRHLVSSADGKFLYVLGELANNVTVLRSLDSGENWTTVQSTSLVAPDRGGKTSAAEISLGPNGRYLYTSIRGADEVVFFSIEALTGKLSRAGAVPTGSEPRFFTIDDSGKWLLSAGQTSGAINVFAIDARTGKLKSQTDQLSVPAPVFIGAAAPR
ncbi:MAG: lactonase family protein, partial [Bryobacteraceae bacterium]